MFNSVRRISDWEAFFSKYSDIGCSGKVFDAYNNCWRYESLPEDEKPFLSDDLTKSIDKCWETEKEQFLKNCATFNVKEALLNCSVNEFSKSSEVGSLGEQDEIELLTCGTSSSDPEEAFHSVGPSQLNQVQRKKVVHLTRGSRLAGLSNPLKIGKKPSTHDYASSNASTELSIPTQKNLSVIESVQTSGYENRKLKSDSASPKSPQRDHEKDLCEAPKISPTLPDAQSCQSERMSEFPQTPVNTSVLDSQLQNFHLQSATPIRHTKTKLTMTSSSRIIQRQEENSELQPASQRNPEPSRRKLNLPNESPRTPKSDFGHQSLTPEHSSCTGNIDRGLLSPVLRTSKPTVQRVTLDSAVLRRVAGSRETRIGISTRRRPLFRTLLTYAHS